MKNSLKGKGAAMRHIREARSKTLQDVAYDMGCSAQELQHMEQGAIEEGSTWVAKLVKWSQSVGISLAVFLEGEWTPANEQVLFLQQREEAKDKALSILATLRPEPTVAEARAVLAHIANKFEMYWHESGRDVIAWRKPSGFDVDEIEVRSMLQRVRSGHPNSKGGP